MTQNDEPDYAERMSRGERRAAAALAAIYFLRMFGLFLILPVLALYAGHLPGATPFLIGLALGAYGLTQALFQVPFGMLSDRYGRKPVIVAGLLLFAAGGAVAALSGHVLGVILGRALQGTGAIAAAVMALAADQTREEQRAKAMAVIGVTIGFAFLSAFVAGPALDAVIGLRGLFWTAAALALISIAVLCWVVPKPQHSAFKECTVHHRECEPESRDLRGLLGQPALLRINAGIFLLHAILTATFVALPVTLRDGLGLASAQHWQVYLPVILASAATVFPLVRLAERPGRGKTVFIGAIATLAGAELVLAGSVPSLALVAAMVLLFFVAFNYLEASLPTLVSRLAPAAHRGTALGAYAMAQFVGTFLGGAAGGWLFGKLGAAGAYGLGAVLGMVWLIVARTMGMPRPLSNHIIRVGRVSPSQAQELTARLLAVAGVSEAVVAPEDGVAYLKVDRWALDRQALTALQAQ